MAICQEQLCEASRDVSAAANWRAIGDEMLQMAKAEAKGYRIPRRVKP